MTMNYFIILTIAGYTVNSANYVDAIHTLHITDAFHNFIIEYAHLLKKLIAGAYTNSSSKMPCSMKVWSFRE